MNPLVEAITEMREEDAVRLAQEELKTGTPPVEILDHCREAMGIIGQRFEAGDCFVPELILAGEILRQISDVVKPQLTQAADVKKIGRVVIGTVEGDIHDIGKDIVTFMLDVNGFEVKDLGVDVPAAKFVEAVKDFQPQVVGLSGFLTLAYDPMKNTMQALRDAGFTGKVMIGGGQIDEQIRQYTRRGCVRQGCHGGGRARQVSGWEGNPMFTPSSNWQRLAGPQRREERFASWMSTDGKPLATALKRRPPIMQRTQRVKDIIGLQKPDRVPLLPFMGAFFALYDGITPQDVMYDYEKYTHAWLRYNTDFQPDYLVFSGAFNPGKIFDLLDYKVYQWPGHGVNQTQPFQCLEAEYMRADEYDQLIADPEGFYRHVYMPRAFGALAGWNMLPTFFASMELPMIPALMVPVGLPPVLQAFEAFVNAGKAALEWAAASGQADGQLMAQYGMPALPGGFTKAPFDIIGDTLRGTRGIMLDMYPPAGQTAGGDGADRADCGRRWACKPRRARTIRSCSSRSTKARTGSCLTTTSRSSTGRH